MIIANTFVVEESDLTSLDNIPAWMTGYCRINSTTNNFECKIGASYVEAEANKTAFFIDTEDSKRYKMDLPDETPTEITTV